MSKHYPVEQRERAVKMVLDHLGEYRSVYAACQAIGPKVAVGVESLRRRAARQRLTRRRRPYRSRTLSGRPVVVVGRPAQRLRLPWRSLRWTGAARTP
jgi:hypothetical protein